MSEPNKDDEIVIVCMPVGWADDSIAEGSHVIRCSYCKRAVWLSPSSHALTYQLALCIPCAGLAIGVDPSPRFGIAAGAIAELLDFEKQRKGRE